MVSSYKKCSNSSYTLGALMDLVFILEERDFENTFKDQDHPHPVERLYKLLTYLETPNDSFLWSFSYDRINRWMMQNKKVFPFEQKSSTYQKILELASKYFKDTREL